MFLFEKILHNRFGGKMDNKEKNWPELIISTEDKVLAQNISRAVKAGTLRKIAPKIYTSNLKDSPENIIKRHRFQILGSLFPQGVISHRSAFEGGFSPDGSIVLTYKYTKLVQLPGFTVRLFQGPGPDSDDLPFLENLYISSRGRAFLENISPSRQREGFIKNFSQKIIEERLDRMARIYGIEELNQLRDQAKEVANRLGMTKEFNLLSQLIGSLLGTQPAIEQKSDVGRARAHGQPFDPSRIELFALLANYLQQQDFPLCKSRANTQQEKMNQAFFEAYFSNYIEGTIFEIEEAKRIIFENKIIPTRPEDSHDILSTYQIITNTSWLEVPTNSKKLIEVICQRHATLMEVRKDKMPGHFKNVVNRRGNTLFVRPEEVIGTLEKGFDFYLKLTKGISRAIFMMFLISEVHPFLDGNGRIARILMNTELEVTNQSRIIIPTVFREDYLLALRKLSRNQDPDPYVRMLLKAQQFTASISYEEYHQTLAQLYAS